ncbi:MAG: response regulator [Gammaproteobacteria bacterium]|nr:response regulator [Gammaproteobacteria bacterium]
MLNTDETILLIEDDRVDIMTVQRALKRNKISNPLYVARTGLEAFGMLRGEDGFDKLSPPPALILLDLNLPKMSGIEFLRELRGDQELKELRIIVLTSSNEPKDQAAAYEYDVDDYIVKPHSFDEFTHAMGTILEYWDGS